MQTLVSNPQKQNLPPDRAEQLLQAGFSQWLQPDVKWGMNILEGEVSISFGPVYGPGEDSISVPVRVYLGQDITLPSEVSSQVQWQHPENAHLLQELVIDNLSKLTAGLTLIPLESEREQQRFTEILSRAYDNRPVIIICSHGGINQDQEHYLSTESGENAYLTRNVLSESIRELRDSSDQQISDPLIIVAACNESDSSDFSADLSVPGLNLIYRKGICSILQDSGDLEIDFL